MPSTWPPVTVTLKGPRQPWEKGKVKKEKKKSRTRLLRDEAAVGETRSASDGPALWCAHWWRREADAVGGGLPSQSKRPSKRE
jgi:hypothetical protein